VSSLFGWLELASSFGFTTVGKGGFLACGRNLAFGAMVAWANVLEVIYDWFKACQAATQFIASYAGVYDV